MHARQVLYAWSTSLALFNLYGDRVLLSCWRWPWTYSPLALASRVLGIGGMHHCVELTYAVLYTIWQTNLMVKQIRMNLFPHSHSSLNLHLQRVSIVITGVFFPPPREVRVMIYIWFVSWVLPQTFASFWVIAMSFVIHKEPLSTKPEFMLMKRLTLSF